MAHSLNLAAKHVLEAFAPTPRRVLAEGNDAAKPAADVDQDEIDEEDGEIDEEDSELDENELVDFQPGDLLGKVHAFVKQACPHFTQPASQPVALGMLFLTVTIRRCASLHKPTHSSPNNASQPTYLSLRFSSGVAHDGHRQTI